MNVVSRITMALECRIFSLIDSSVELYIYVDNNHGPWFRARTIAKFLGYVEPDLAVRINVSGPNKLAWGALPFSITNSVERPLYPTTVFINEAGLDQLLSGATISAYVRDAFNRWRVEETGRVVRDAVRKQINRRAGNAAKLKIDDITRSDGFLFMATTMVCNCTLITHVICFKNL